MSKDSRSGSRPSISATESSNTSLPKGFDLYDYIPFLLIISQHTMHRVVRPESDLEIAEIASLSKGDSRVLTLIASNTANSPTEIADILGLDRGVITRHLKSLTNSELIKSQADDSDLRRKTFCTTELGESVAIKIFSKMKKFGDYLNSSITMNEKKFLIEILVKLDECSERFPE